MSKRGDGMSGMGGGGGQALVDELDRIAKLPIDHPVDTFEIAAKYNTNDNSVAQLMNDYLGDGDFTEQDVLDYLANLLKDKKTQASAMKEMKVAVKDFKDSYREEQRINEGVNSIITTFDPYTGRPISSRKNPDYQEVVDPDIQISGYTKDGKYMSLNSESSYEDVKAFKVSDMAYIYMSNGYDKADSLGFGYTGKHGYTRGSLSGDFSSAMSDAIEEHFKKK